MRCSTILFLFVFVSFQSLAKVYDEPGIVVWKNGDTTYVTFKVPMGISTGLPDYPLLQYRIKCIDSTGKAMYVGSRLAAEYSFEWEYETIRMISVPNSLPKGGSTRHRTIFLKVEEDGPMRVFLFCRKITSTYGAYVNQQNNYGFSMTPYYIQVDTVVQRTGFEPIYTNERTFEKKMSEYLTDCPELVEEIELGHFQYDDLSAMAAFYNVRCGKLENEAETGE